MENLIDTGVRNQQGSSLGFELTVTALRRDECGVATLDLSAANDRALPAFEPGAHLDITLPNGMKRSYSIASPPRELWRYTLGVKLEPDSRGGSRFIHEALKVGDVLQVSQPKNYFRLDRGAAGHVFIAGGIGITPFLSMLAEVKASGVPWQLLYAFNDNAGGSFLQQLQALAGMEPQRVRLHRGGRSGNDPLDIAAAVARLRADWSIYCCGPERMLQEFVRQTACLNPARVHLERFGNPMENSGDESFMVELARSGKHVVVKPGQSILDALELEGVDVTWGCREGLCGSCAVTVLAGVPQHRDKVLSEEERRINKTMLICCSRSESAHLVLDL